jgi:hypothetical protein
MQVPTTTTKMSFRIQRTIPPTETVYSRYMKATTVKISVETRERIRALGGATAEETIVEAIDALEADRFWAQADAALAWRKGLSAERLAELKQQEAEVDAAFDGIG